MAEGSIFQNLFDMNGFVSETTDETSAEKVILTVWICDHHDSCLKDREMKCGR